MTVIQAMAKMEGYGVPGSRPNRNNNPLDLEYCSESVRFGAVLSDGRFAKFETPGEGWDAGRKWLSVPAKFDKEGKHVGGYMGATLRQVINRFAPPNENDSGEYLANVSSWSGVEPDTVLTPEILG